MARSRDKRKDVADDDAPRVGAIGCLRSAFRTLILVLGILYVATLLISRTEGFRTMAEDRFSSRLGVNVSIGHIRVLPNLGLSLRDLTTKGYEDRSGVGAHVELVQMDWAWSRAVRPGVSGWTDVELSGCTLSLQQNETGVWQPAVVVPLVRWIEEGLALRPGREPIVDAVTSRWDTVQVTLDRADIYWWDAQAQLARSLRDAAYARTPLKVPRGALTHHHLTWESVTEGDAGAAPSGSVEWIETDARRVNVSGE